VTKPSVTEVTPDRFPEVAPRVERIDASVRAATGRPALGDAVWRDFERPGPDSAGFLIGDHAYAHIARAENEDDHGWVLGLAIEPGEGADGARAALVHATAQHARANGGGRISLWLLGADARSDTELSSAGMRADRELYEMRVALPLGLEASWPPGITVRTFDLGNDEDAWLAVNNRAFAGHAEQGGWTRATLARRLAEPWFDPSLFLLAFDAKGLAGFNWLKVHAAGAADGDPALGEIYAIGVDPRMQGLRLGPALAIAGLDAVAARGIGTGMLFVAADNEPALKLYRSLGFTVHRIDRAYELEVAPT
jgi:mycothiol synthase